MTDPQFNGTRHMWECDHCSAVFISLYDLRRHKANPEDRQLYKCRTCNDVFIFPDDLYRHELLQHKSENKVRTLEDNERAESDLSSRMKMVEYSKTWRVNIREKVNELRKLTGLTDKHTIVEVLNYVIYVLNGLGLTGLASPFLPQESMRYQKHNPPALEGHNALKMYVIKNGLCTDRVLSRCKVLDIIITVFKNIKAEVSASLIAPPLALPLPTPQHPLPQSIAPQPSSRPAPVSASPLVFQHPFSIKNLLRPTRPN